MKTQNICYFVGNFGHFKFPRMQCTGVLQEGFGKMNCYFTIVLPGFGRGKKQHKLHRSEAEVLLIFTDLRVVLGRL